LPQEYTSIPSSRIAAVVIGTVIREVQPL